MALSQENKTNNLFKYFNAAFFPSPKDINLGMHISLMGIILSSYLTEIDYLALMTTCRTLAGRHFGKRNSWGKKAYEACYGKNALFRVQDINHQIFYPSYTTGRCITLRSESTLQTPVLPDHTTSFCCYMKSGNEMAVISASDIGTYDNCFNQYICSTVQAPIRCAATWATCVICPCIPCIDGHGDELIVNNCCGRTKVACCCFNSIVVGAGTTAITEPTERIGIQLWRDDKKNCFMIPWIKTNVQTVPCIFAYCFGTIGDAIDCIPYRIKQIFYPTKYNFSFPRPDLARKALSERIKIIKPEQPTMKRNDAVDYKHSGSAAILFSGSGGTVSELPDSKTKTLSKVASPH